MSNPRPPRRRRIAGERRRAPEPVSGSAPEAEQHSAPPAAPPPSLRKEPPGGRSEAEATEPAARERPPRTPRARPRLLVVVPLVLLILAGLAYVVLMFVGVPRVTDFEDLREAERARVAAESAPSVAERAAEAILAYDHRTIDADRDAAQRFMTPDFAEEYATTFDRTVKPAARTYNARVAAEVQGSSVVRSTEDSAKVLLFVDQTTRSTAHQQPQVALNRVEFEMVLRGGEWLVDDISSY